MIVGITGASGSGKHTFSEYFKVKNWVLIDADYITHQLYRPYTHLWKKVVDHFGEKILNQNDSINRSRLGKIVFNPEDPDDSLMQLKILNEMIHPSLKREIEDRIHRHFRRRSNLVIITALWKDLDLIDLTDVLVLMRAKEEIASKRIEKRDYISPAMYKMRMRLYSDPLQPDFKIDNNESLEDLNEKFNHLYKTLVQMDSFHSKDKDK